MQAWTWGWGQKKREVWPRMSASSVSPQKRAFLPLNRALLLRGRQPRMGGSLSRTPVLCPSLCYPSGCYGDQHLLCVLGSAGVCGTFSRTVVFQPPPTPPLQGSSSSSRWWQTRGPDTGFFTFLLWLHKSLPVAGSGSFNFQI